MSIGANLMLRIAAIVLVVFIALQLLVLGLVGPIQQDGQRDHNLPSAREAAAIADALDRAPASQRSSLAGALDGALYTITVTADRLAIRRGASSQVADLQAEYASAMPGRRVLVEGRKPRFGRLIGTSPRPARFGAPITVSIALRNGGFVMITSRPSAPMRNYLRDRSVIGALGGLILLVALMLAVRQTTRPLVRLSRGVRRFAANLDEPDLPVKGPREVRDVAQALNEMKARIAELLEERTRVLAAIAHDMRTYLTRLRLRAEFITDAGQRERAIRDLDEMSALLSDTLLLAVQGEGGALAEPLDVAAELAALVAERRDLGERIDLACPFAKVAITARRTAFRRILSNLIDNGRRYGDRVSIGVSRIGDRMTIIVTDDGPGVPADALPRLGQLFHRLDPSRDRETGGAGLGLAIVRALAAHDGAEVVFANSEGAGLKVTLTYKVWPMGDSLDDAT